MPAASTPGSTTRTSSGRTAPPVGGVGQARAGVRTGVPVGAASVNPTPATSSTTMKAATSVSDIATSSESSGIDWTGVVLDLASGIVPPPERLFDLAMILMLLVAGFHCFMHFFFLYYFDSETAKRKKAKKEQDEGKKFPFAIVVGAFTLAVVGYEYGGCYACAFKKYLGMTTSLIQGAPEAGLPVGGEL
ncbi:unnamed protein product [Amoebophrya sp. A25]|nr:unnamed protein product [Amoebophrya sp. A25]|eukprot:GSA25T00023047001.1